MDIAILILIGLLAGVVLGIFLIGTFPGGLSSR
jgi:hypothetical protein